MGSVRQHEPALLFLALFSRYEEAIAWGLRRACAQWGSVALQSEPFAFQETAYYSKTMGTDLTKVLVVFESLIDPATLPGRKHAANRWEREYAEQFAGPEPRPLNLDPGYLTQAKLVLASTKDRDHRIYLSDGIFAENTLYYRGGAWQNRPWTYPNYRREDYHQFLDRCRDYLRRSRPAASDFSSRRP